MRNKKKEEEKEEEEEKEDDDKDESRVIPFNYNQFEKKEENKK